MSIRVDETKPDIEATEPVIPTTLLARGPSRRGASLRPCRPVQGLQRHHAHQDSLCPHGPRALRGRHRRGDRNLAVCGVAPAAHAQAVAPGQVPPRRPQHSLLARRRSCLHHAQPGHEPYLRIAINHGISAAGTQTANTGKGTHHEKTQFKLDEIDCANCARELQDELAKLDGVKSVSVNFMTQKLTLEADDAEFDEVLDRVVSSRRCRAGLRDHSLTRAYVDL